MKILHYQHNGVGVVISKYLNRIPGVTSKVLSTRYHPFGYKADWTFPYSTHLVYWSLATIFPKAFDILHCHDNNRLPAYVLNKWTGRFIHHYHNPLAFNLYPEKAFPSFVAVPSMTTRIYNSTWLPIPVDTDLFYPIVRKPHNKLVVGLSYNPNADTNKLQFIPYQEVKALVDKFTNIELLPLTTTLPYTEMPNYYRKLDIYVDRTGFDFYGWQAAEAATCGVFVLSEVPVVVSLHNAANVAEQCLLKYRSLYV